MSIHITNVSLLGGGGHPLALTKPGQEPAPDLFRGYPLCGASVAD